MSTGRADALPSQSGIPPQVSSSPLARTKMTNVRFISIVIVSLTLICLDGCYTITKELDYGSYQNKYYRLYGEAVGANSSLVEGVVTYQEGSNLWRGGQAGYVLTNWTWIYNNYPFDFTGDIFLSDVDSSYVGRTVQMLGTYEIEYDRYNNSPTMNFYITEIEIER